MDEKFVKATEIINDSSHVTVFTGAGISVESGIPPFRGENGVWNKYDHARFLASSRSQCKRGQNN
ncbi:MAG TPA: Sir2 family NAD-dependent protein deacetylase [Halanaerobiales bacterium]|nr:Sir2 family NAD-dependent protein deacetylase [Halanaerobiales bacterium]